MNIEYVNDSCPDEEPMQIDLDYDKPPSKPILKRQDAFISLATIPPTAPPLCNDYRKIYKKMDRLLKKK